MPGAFRADAVGPVDVAVITFQGNGFSGEVAPALADLQASGIVRLIDLAFVRKDADGSVKLTELGDADVKAAYAKIVDPRFDLVSSTDLAELADALPPESSALVVAWENSWLAEFASAVQSSRGEVAAFERISFDVVRQALAEAERRERAD